jgi:hypothetical protein
MLMLYLLLSFNLTLFVCTDANELGAFSGTCGDKKKVWRILVGISERRKPHERHSRKWKYYIKMHPNETGYKNMDWI